VVASLIPDVRQVYVRDIRDSGKEPGFLLTVHAPAPILAIQFGTGAALVLDEFALWFRLDRSGYAVTVATFGTAISCIDGRIQIPVITWIREFLSVDYVDLVTEPGSDALLAANPSAANERVFPRVRLSVVGHGSSVVAVAGHFDCLANPVDETEHRAQLHKAVDVVLGWQLGVKVLALWVDQYWQVQVVKTRSPS
jgi:hypothetical protein